MAGLCCLALKCKHCHSDITAPKEIFPANTVRDVTTSYYATVDQKGKEVLNYDAIKALAIQLIKIAPKSTAITIIVTNESVIERLKSELPISLRN